METIPTVSLKYEVWWTSRFFLFDMFRESQRLIKVNHLVKNTDGHIKMSHITADTHWQSSWSKLSMDWFKGQISWENPWFPVDFPKKANPDRIYVSISIPILSWAIFSSSACRTGSPPWMQMEVSENRGAPNHPSH